VTNIGLQLAKRPVYQHDTDSSRMAYSTLSTITPITPFPTWEFQDCAAWFRSRDVLLTKAWVARYSKMMPCWASIESPSIGISAHIRHLCFGHLVQLCLRNLVRRRCFLSLDVLSVILFAVFRASPISRGRRRSD
jgi:hypothetical protein